MQTAGLYLRSATHGEWVRCPPDEITWLDRDLLSGGEDLTLHRAPRCAGLRHVHHRWELFSRDTTYRVYLAPDQENSPEGAEAGKGACPRADADAVQRTALHILPVAPARYEALPVVLEQGRWQVSVGAWVLRLRLDAPARSSTYPAAADGSGAATTRGAQVIRRGGASTDAVIRVRGYFERNPTARLAIAYYYQEFIIGLPAPQSKPMADVVIALDLSGEGAVSDYKKLLQGLIWNERGHARDLAGFLLANGLLTPADLDEARQVADGNERSGVCDMARRRLRYRPKDVR